MGPRSQPFIDEEELDDYYIAPPWGNFEAMIIDSLTLGLLFTGWWFEQGIVTWGSLGALRYYRAYQYADPLVTAGAIGVVYGTYLLTRSIPLAFAGEFAGLNAYVVWNAQQF